MATLERLFDLSRDLLCIANTDGFFVEINPAFQKTLEHSKEELTSVPFVDLVHPSDRAATIAQLQKLRQGTEVLQFENRYRCKDGSYKWLAWIAIPDTTEKLIYAVARDVTDTRQSLDDLLGTLPGMVYRCLNDARYTMMYASSGCLELTGYAAEELVEARSVSFSDIIHRDDLKRVQDQVHLAVERQRDFQLEYRIVTKSGEEKIVSEKGRALQRGAGTKATLQGYISDITGRRKLEDELNQMQRMESLGHLTGGVAHDFNNLLTVIAGNLQLLEPVVENGPSAEYVKDALDAAWRGAELCNRLLAFGRRQMLASEMTDINELVRRVQRLAARTISENVQMSVSLDAELPQVLVDQQQLENAILNLLINARDAMPQGGSIFVRTGMFSAGRGYVSLHPDVVEGDYVSVEVSDTGSGMTAEILDRAFEPFFTTKEPGKGTGLGLSMVYGLLKQSGGHVRIYSEPEHGTSVKLFIPVPMEQDAAVYETTRLAATDIMPGGIERILVVEDDSGVRKMVVAILSELGYRIEEADSPSAALEILNAGEDIDLLFTDVVMPGAIDGVALANEALRSKPGIKVLLTSGFSRHHLAERAEFPLLNKPYQKKQLAAAVRQVLDS